MLIPTNDVNSIRPAASVSADSHPFASTSFAALNDPARDVDARRAFENLLVAELTRRFGDNRSYSDRTTREWTLHVVRRRYWSIWVYLAVASLFWLGLMLAGIVAAFAVLDPQRTGVSFLFLSFLVAVAVAPFLQALERRFCADWVLGLKSRRPQSKPDQGRTASPASHASELRDRAA